MASIFRTTLWLRTKGEPQPPLRSANFIDVLILVLILVTAILIASIFYDSSLRSQVNTDEEQTRALREKVATLQEQLGDTVAANHLAISETSVPHPVIQDRDSQAIGDHTTVTWDYENQFSGRYVNFEMELIKLGPTAVDCGQFVGTLECGRPMRFITSDGMNHTSRIPTDLKGTLTPGTYSWRVAPVPAETVVNDDVQKDDLNRLSDWSDYGSFTLFPSLIERVASTHVIRVGTNLEQDTRFSRRGHDGRVTGFDINLIHTMVEQCLAFDKTTSPPALSFDRDQCGRYIQTLATREQLIAPAPPCPSSAPLCITLVPIQKWGDWQSALKRKEIDLFIGAVTAATDREKSGVLFTPGYLHYNSRIFGHAADVLAAHSDLRSWLASPRKIGVIEFSTNEELLKRLIQDPDLKKRKLAGNLEKKGYPSFPAIEHAMDRGELDAILIDETFVEHDDWKPLDGLRGTWAWHDYEKNYLGRYPDEQVAIAVAVAGDRSHLSRQKGDLYSALDDALSNRSPLTLLYLPRLCKAFWNDSSSYSCRKGTEP